MAHCCAAFHLEIVSNCLYICIASTLIHIKHAYQELFLCGLSKGGKGDDDVFKDQQFEIQIQSPHRIQFARQKHSRNDTTIISSQIFACLMNQGRGQCAPFCNAHVHSVKSPQRRHQPGRHGDISKSLGLWNFQPLSSK